MVEVLELSGAAATLEGNRTAERERFDRLADSFRDLDPKRLAEQGQ